MLYLQQYGFQKRISTNTVTSTNNNIHRNKFTAIFLIHLKKAFYTVCHKTVLRKLYYYGLCGPVDKLLDSYLLRHQFVSFNNTHSTIQLNGHVVPQGLTLGPLLFLFCVNNLPNAV